MFIQQGKIWCLVANFELSQKYSHRSRNNFKVNLGVSVQIHPPRSINQIWLKTYKFKPAVEKS
jgi:hypothetical protein